MGQAIVQAFIAGLEGVRNLLLEAALPIAVLLGLAAVAGAIAANRDPEGLKGRLSSVGGWGARAWGYLGVGVLVVCFWHGLGALSGLARTNMEWRDSAEATRRPTEDAPPVYQFGPAAASISEKTYTRTLTLPPSFLQTIGEQGIGVLSPYLTDPTAESIIRLRDTFRQSGQDVVFTREATQKVEEPIPFEQSTLKATFKPSGTDGFEIAFEGEFAFKNGQPDAILGRFSFPLPDGGTIRDLSVKIDGEEVRQDPDTDAYVWEGTVNAGATKKAVATFRANGGTQWQYDLGSQRRRVKSLRLDVTSEMPLRFVRGSIQPVSSSETSATWQLKDVISQQRIGLKFQKDSSTSDGSLQALAMAPFALLIGLATLVVGGMARGVRFGPARLARAAVMLGFGFGSPLVLAPYIGPVAGLLVGPLLGAALAGLGALGGKHREAWGIATPLLLSALVPATFLSAENTGLLLLIIAGAALWTLSPIRRSA
ncbi:MAG: hypothetical protein HZC36_03505 [Armatimonadetes bacterium]|nr:hypothetical protein [Armatimonadota bacterium]